MAGQIIKRGDRTWVVRIFTGRDEKGKRNYVNKTIHGTKKDAEKYLTATQRDRDLGVFIEPCTLSVSEYLNKWLEAAACPRLRERTFADYKEKLDRYVRPVIGEKKLADVRPLDIQTLYGQMQ